MSWGAILENTNVGQRAVLLQMTDVSIRYGNAHHGKVVAHDLNINLRQGELVGLVGESGSGKTSVARVALGLLRPARGEVSVLGRTWSEMSSRDERHFRADIQGVFQDPIATLDPRQRIDRGLHELRRYHPTRSVGVSDEELFAQVDLTPGMLHRYPHQLSGGQAQRVAIARALLLEPRILIADEATSSLDVSLQAQIMRLVRKISLERHLGVIVVSHDITVVRHMCDRIYVMSEGRVVEEGVTREVLDTPVHEHTRNLVNAVPGRRRHSQNMEMAAQ